ncbi:MAG: hypothetical protein ACE5DK_02230 [Paracoccaceae bacterium]
MTNDAVKPEHLKSLEARIIDAFDRIADLANGSDTQAGDGLSLRERDRELIEELEATLAEERADVAAERAEVKRLKDRLIEAENRIRVAQEARGRAEKALEEAQASVQASSKTIGVSDEDQSKLLRLQERIEAQNVQFERLRGANARLRESIGVLRDRNREMLGDAAAIDQAMASELASIKTVRAAEVDEMNAIMEELKPLMEGQDA